MLCAEDTVGNFENRAGCETDELEAGINDKSDLMHGRHPDGEKRGNYDIVAIGNTLQTVDIGHAPFEGRERAACGDVIADG